MCHTGVPRSKERGTSNPNPSTSTSSGLARFTQFNHAKRNLEAGIDGGHGVVDEGESVGEEGLVDLEEQFVVDL